MFGNLLASARIKLREKTNPLLAPYRRYLCKLQYGGVNNSFTIISNDCWAGHVYRYFGFNYLTPTVGLYFFSPEYLKFVSNLKHYIESDLSFINYKQSKYTDEIVKRHQENVPIGVLDDVEIMFLHYKTTEEAQAKWNRRKCRINWDNIYVKMSEMNLCSESLLREFDKLGYSKKVIFVTKDYGLASQILFRDYLNKDEIKNDTTNFRKYINLKKWLNQ